MARGAHSTAPLGGWGVQAGEEFCCFRRAREVQIIIAAFGRRGWRADCGNRMWLLVGMGRATDGDLLMALTPSLQRILDNLLRLS